jgi:hypothetical protein
MAEAEEILAADYYPPAARGDIYRIIASGVRTIVLIDGVFHNTRSVWQREILDALGEGIEVFGASSMGALRAAELGAFGMVGHGTIFKWYKDGLIDGDDEVVLLHGPKELEFCALSEPLVNIRRTLQNAVSERCMSEDQARQLLDHAKRIYYPERSFSDLLMCPALQDWPDRAGIEQYILTKAVDQKRLDAIGVLRRCANGQAPAKPAAAMSQESGPDFWRPERLRLTGFSCGSEIVRGSDVLSEAEKDSDLCARLVPVLLARAFVMDLARRKQLSLSDHLLEAFTARWEKALNVVPDTSWLRANGLTSLSYRRLLAQHFVVDWLVDQDAGGSDVESGFSSPGQVSPIDRVTFSRAAVRSYRALQPEFAAKGDLDQLSAVVSMPRPRLLAEWAGENGVSCPSGAVGDSPADLALMVWLIEKGPRHFGVDWCLESALLEELQITGLAAQLMAKAASQ